MISIIYSSSCHLQKELYLNDLFLTYIIWFFTMSSEMVSHTSRIPYTNSSLVENFLPANLLFIIAHTCSIGFKSGEWAGHFKKFIFPVNCIFLLVKNSLVYLDPCMGALSYWKIRLCCCKVSKTWTPLSILQYCLEYIVSALGGVQYNWVRVDPHIPPQTMTTLPPFYFCSFINSF